MLCCCPVCDKSETAVYEGLRWGLQKGSDAKGLRLLFRKVLLHVVDESGCSHARSES